MKKILQFFALALIISFISYSQSYKTYKSDRKSDIHFGLTAGVAFPTFTGEHSDQFSSKTDFVVGCVVENYRDGLTFNGGALYYRKGASATENHLELTFDFDYLEIPVYFRYIFTTNGSARPFVQFGGYLSYLLSSKGSIKYNGQTSTGDISNISSFDSGILAGAGAIFALSPNNNLAVQLRYELGLIQFSSDNALTNSSFAILTSVSF
ncbi:MAG: PorT family protein [Ignavibacteria bacterium]|nr:PorT family protein [Ignavibacteria bacterium]